MLAFAGKVAISERTYRFISVPVRCLGGECPRNEVCHGERVEDETEDVAKERCCSMADTLRRWLLKKLEVLSRTKGRFGGTCYEADRRREQRR